MQILTSIQRKYSLKERKCFSVMDKKWQLRLYIDQVFFRTFVHSNFSIFRFQRRCTVHMIFLVIKTPHVHITFQPTYILDTEIRNMNHPQKIALNGTQFSSHKKNQRIRMSDTLQNKNEHVLRHVNTPSCQLISTSAMNIYILTYGFMRQAPLLCSYNLYIG